VTSDQRGSEERKKLSEEKNALYTQWVALQQQAEADRRQYTDSVAATASSLVRKKKQLGTPLEKQQRD
jgi:hypothetical protein